MSSTDQVDEEKDDTTRDGQVGADALIAMVGALGRVPGFLPPPDRAPEAGDGIAGQSWTREIPTENGWYWFLYDEDKWPDLPKGFNEPRMYWCSPAHGVMEYHDFVNAETHECRKVSALWCGPLAVPNKPRFRGGKCGITT